MRSFGAVFYRNLLLKNVYLRKNMIFVGTRYMINSARTSLFQQQCLKMQSNLNALLHFNSREGSTYEYPNEFDEFENEAVEPIKYAKHMLYVGSSDLIINELNNCASVDQVLSSIKRYEPFLKPDHMTQAILVLKDLQDMCYRYNNFSERALNKFVQDLTNNEQFKRLLELIKHNLDKFDEKLLSYVLLYLFKLGMSADDEFIQQIAYKLKDSLTIKFSLDICARLLSVIFSERSVRPYYISLNLIPTIIKSIGKKVCMFIYIIYI